MGHFYYFSTFKNGAGLWDDIEHSFFSVFFQIKSNKNYVTKV